MAQVVKKTATTHVVIPPSNMQAATFRIVGTAPFVQHAFSQKSAQQILSKHIEGKTARGKKAHEPRDIEEEYRAAMHIDETGKNGIPVGAFRSAMISACRLVGFQMTKAKLSVFVEGDGIDAVDGVPLVHIHGEPELHQSSVRLETGVASIAIRPMWRKWSADVKVVFDGDQFRMGDVANLLTRAGIQVGIGEGRPDSKKSHGMGWGTFRVESSAQAVDA